MFAEPRCIDSRNGPDTARPRSHPERRAWSVPHPEIQRGTRILNESAALEKGRTRNCAYEGIECVRMSLAALSRAFSQGAAARRNYGAPRADLAFVQPTSAAALIRGGANRASNAGRAKLTGLCS